MATRSGASTKRPPSKTGTSRTPAGNARSAGKSAGTSEDKRSGRDHRRRSSRRGRSALNPGFPRWAIATLVVVLVGAVGAWLVFYSSVFGVRDIEVRGAALASSAQIEQAVDLTSDTALASVDLDAVAKRIEQQVPIVRSAKVTRSWPGTLVVTVTERSPVATVTVHGDQWVIDETGTPYLAVDDYPSDLPALLPLDVDDPSPDDLATTEAVTVIAALDQPTIDLTESVSAPSAGEVTLHLHDGRTVIWGDSSRMQDKLTMLPAVLEHKGSEYDISSPQAIVIQ